MSNNDRLIVKSITGADVDLPIAGPGGRSYAFIIDWHIRFLLALLWFVVFLVGFSGSLDVTNFRDNLSAGLGLLVVLPGPIMYFLYHPVLEILMKGSTPGKRIAGIRIVDRHGGIPTVGALLVRNIFRLIDGLPGLYLIGLVTTFFSKQSVRIGDLAAGTVLVYQARQKASSFDGFGKLHGDHMEPEKAELIQDVLARWGALDSSTRRAIGTKLLASSSGNFSVPHEDDDLRDAIEKLLQ